MEFLIGGLGFVLFFLYDWNRVFWKRRWMSSFFLVGCLCQTAAGIGMLRAVWLDRSAGWPVYLIFAAAFLVVLIYTLFFALPFDSTYCQEADGHKVCRSGMYGWCRHPGIWWFFGCFFCMGLACAEVEQLFFGLGLSVLNLLYAWYQDKWIFPQEFSDYEDYREEVPFLMPQKGKGKDSNGKGGECG